MVLSNVLCTWEAETYFMNNKKWCSFNIDVNFTEMWIMVSKKQKEKICNNDAQKVFTMCYFALKKIQQKKTKAK